MSDADGSQDIKQSDPTLLGKRIPVPEELINAGKPTSLPRDADTQDALDNDFIGDGDLIERLPQDGGTPFSPPDDSPATHVGHLDDTHPATDSASDIDSQQLYNEGLAGAAEAVDPLYDRGNG